MCQKKVFELNSVLEADKLTVLADDSVARNYDRNRVFRTGMSDRTLKFTRFLDIFGG